MWVWQSEKRLVLGMASFGMIRRQLLPSTKEILEGLKMKQAKIVGVVAPSVAMDAVYYDDGEGQERLLKTPIIALALWERVDDFASDDQGEELKVYAHLEPLEFDKDGFFCDPSDSINFMGFALKGEREKLEDWREEINDVKKKFKECGLKGEKND